MKFNQVGIVYLKELKDILRDRRTLISMVLVPIILFPLLMGGVSFMMGGQMKKLEKKSKPIAVIGGDNSPLLIKYLFEDETFQIIDTIRELPVAKALLKDKGVLAVVAIPDDFDVKLTAFFAGEGESPALELYSDESEVESEMTRTKVKNAIFNYRNELVSSELKKRSIRGDLLQPFIVESINTASESEMGGFVAGMIMPYMVIILTLIGAMYPAIDLTAGEKERGTLETLLVSPIGRMEIVLGKYFVVLTASMVTAILSMVSMGMTLSGGLLMADIAETGIKLSFTPQMVGGILLLLLPNAMLFSALLMAIAVFARSYREAQSYISPLMIVVILPAMVSYIPGVEITVGMAITPVVNTVLMMKNTLSGNFDPAMAGLTFLATIIYAGIAIFIAFRLFQKESVLFRV